VTFDGLKIRGDYSDLSRCCGDGVFFADYMAKEIVITNSDIQGMKTGIIAPESGHGTNPNLTIQNSNLRNWTNIVVPVVGSVNGCWMDNKLVVINSNTFAASPGQPLSNIAMVGDVANAGTCPSKLSVVQVYNYNGKPGDNFQVFHQNPSWLPAPTCTTTARPEIAGFWCPIAPLAALSAPAPTRLAMIGLRYAKSGFGRVEVAMRRLLGTAGDPTPTPSALLVCRAPQAS
jgi:hypothetical protein